MTTLILSGDTLDVHLERTHLKVSRRVEDGQPPKRTRIPLFDVERIVLSGRPHVTIPVIQKFLKLGIPLFFVTSHGKWIGALHPDNNLNAARRIGQYDASKDRLLALDIARKLVCAKLRNSRRVLQRLAANRKESGEHNQLSTCNELKNLARRTASCSSLQELRGIEGMGAARYFQRLGCFFPDDIPFTERNRRPPKDPANALLSWGYTILLGEIDGAIRMHGLDAGIGFLHQLHHGTPALAVDLIETLRAPVIDLLTLNILNHGVLNKKDFYHDTEKGGVFLKQEAHKSFFFAYENAMKRQFKLKPDAAQTDFREIIREQVFAILRALNNEPFEFFQMP